VAIQELKRESDLFGSPGSGPSGSAHLRLLRTNRNPEVSGRRRRALLFRSLVAGDVIALCAAFFGAQIALHLSGSTNLGTGAGPVLFLASLPLWLFMGTLLHLYDRGEERPDHTTVDDLGAIFSMVTIGSWLFFALVSVLGPQVEAARPFLLTWGLAVPAVTLARISVRAIARRRTSFIQNVVILGAGDVGQLIAGKILKGNHHRVNVVGFVDSEPKPLAPDLAHLALLGPPERLPQLIEELDVERVIVAFSSATHDQTVSLVRLLRDNEVQVDIIPRLFESYGTRVGVHAIEGLPLVGLPTLRLSPAALALKRGLDVALSLGALVSLAPVFALIALWIKRDSPGPVFYRHDRLGKDGQPVSVYKFRTMFLEHCRGPEFGGDAAEEEFQRLMTDPHLRAEFEQSHKLASDPRVTSVGAFLRRTSLDELPQLINVLKGDISLVGPRPITREELPRYGRGAHALLNLKPGLTGYWQISGRSDTSYEERVRLDMAYVSSWSLKGDLKILAKTFGKVFVVRQGAV
jgi:exopolysaccharide biosynthesis polyprenyl glycosylphosphotransferase